MNKDYIDFIAGLKQNIIQSRYIATRLVNREQLMLYFKTGKMLADKLQSNSWGAKVVKQIADDLQKALPGLRGFSHRNLMNMKKFYLEYQPIIFMQSPPAQFKHLTNISIGQISAKTKATNIKEEFWKISFTHHMLILNKCSTNPERFFYIEQAASLFWSVSVLEHHIQADLYSNQGKLPNNFASTLPDKLTPSALQVFQDEYLMDFITPPAVDDERVLENKVVSEIKNFILWMGKGFSFIGNQYRLEIDGEEFFIDLLFFNRHLQCLVAFELKRGKFKPEYAGQLNFYLNVLDEKVRLPHENPSIGIVLCKEKNNTIVEFAVRTIDKAMGVATYRTTKEVPKEMKGILPDAGELAKLL
jgi:predicted nuclease of restriction endonuclease-like (RecB) superfamily